MSEGFVNPLARSGPSVIACARAIKAWAREIGAFPEDAVVSVSELACPVPGCAPKETVVLVMLRGDILQVSIHKALTEVTRDDLAGAFAARPEPR